MSSTALQRMSRASAASKTSALSAELAVAAMTRKEPSRSEGSKSLGSQSRRLARTYSAILGVTLGEMTRILAWARSSAGIFSVAMEPPPMMVIGRLWSLRNAGKRVLIGRPSSWLLRRSDRREILHCADSVQDDGVG